ncbi:hypothetical protein TRSC58_05700 [Trypanosoma rangeli SC58]|uniref:Uncharacterized protein n=1 Tax=Trypanosoma rangeli SC58 TaxID=429131 RepID=A0A061IU70_TRYRA|nr:hypothetical protein TRSC58_05700 [Trypanosoma rangeli SC58]
MHVTLYVTLAEEEKREFMHDKMKFKGIQPNELSPLTTLTGSDISLEDAVRCSATFLLWERLYGITTVSPTAYKTSVYCLQQRQRSSAVGSSTGPARKNGLLLQRPYVVRTQGSFMHDMSKFEGGREAGYSVPRDVPGCASMEALPQGGKSVFSEGNSIAATDDFHRDVKNTVVRRERSPSLRVSKKCETSPSIDEVENRELFSFPPLLSTPPAGQSVPLSGSGLFSPHTPYRAVAEETTLQFQEADVREDNVMVRGLESGGVSDDVWLPRSSASDVLKLGNYDNTIDNTRGSEFFEICAGRGKADQTQTNPTRATSHSVPQWPRWETSMEPRRVTNNEVLDDAIQCGNHGTERVIMFPEGVSAHSDDEQATVASDAGPSSLSRGSVPLASSLRPTHGRVGSETPLGRRSGEAKVDGVAATQLRAGEGTVRKTRQYRPPVFYSARVPDNAVTAAMGGDEVVSYAQGSGGTSVPVRKTSADVSVVTHTEPAVQDPHDDAMPPPQDWASSLFAETNPVASSASSFSEDLQGTDGDERRSQEMNTPTGSWDDEHVVSFLSLGKDRKTASPRASPQEAENGGPHHQQLGGKEEEEEEDARNISLGEPTDKPFSVSPSPSFKDYEWAAKAQEALEQQQRRFCARTPSTNPPSPPPPLQVCGFELPQPPRGRHLAAPVSFNRERDVASSKSPEKPRGPSALPKNAASLPARNSAKKLPSKRASQTALRSQRAELGQGHLSGTPKPDANTRKRPREAMVSSPPPEEFPLPRTMPTSESAIRKKKDTKKRTKKQ